MPSRGLTLLRPPRHVAPLGLIWPRSRRLANLAGLAGCCTVTASESSSQSVGVGPCWGRAGSPGQVGLGSLSRPPGGVSTSSGSDLWRTRVGRGVSANQDDGGPRHATLALLRPWLARLNDPRRHVGSAVRHRHFDALALHMERRIPRNAVRKDASRDCSEKARLSIDVRAVLGGCLDSGWCALELFGAAIHPCATPSSPARGLFSSPGHFQWERGRARCSECSECTGWPWMT